MHLPPPQEKLEADYKSELRAKYGITFDRLYTITNMPISRFERSLRATGQLESYMERLVEAFNPAAARDVMCRTMLSVGWEGRLYDCDFNQMLEMPLRSSKGELLDIRNVTAGQLLDAMILTGPHCFGCTAGAGSSCGGVLVK